MGQRDSYIGDEASAKVSLIKKRSKEIKNKNTNKITIK
jgi:hypothetical protein